MRLAVIICNVKHGLVSTKEAVKGVRKYAYLQKHFPSWKFLHPLVIPAL